jgi:hypothetical protein
MYCRKGRPEQKCLFYQILGRKITVVSKELAVRLKI